jgi:general secretion pathway protein N
VRLRTLVAVGAAIFLAGLLVRFPARVAYSWFVPEDVQLSGLSGTAWNGSALEGRVGGLYVRDLTWDFRPLALLGGKAGYDFTAQSASGPLSGRVAVGPGGAVHVSELRARVPIAALSELATFVGVDGLLSADVRELVLEDGFPVRAEGTLEVANLVARQLSPSPLGAYRAELTTADDVVRATIEDGSGVLDLEGTLELRPNRSYLLTGRVAPTAGAPENVVRQLTFLGSPDADGKRSFRFEGRMP